MYRGDRWYCPRPKSEVVRQLLRRQFAGRQRVFLLGTGARCQARVVARRSPSLKDEGGKPVGLLGFFEALQSEDAGIDTLLRQAANWLRDQGVGSIVGPMDGDTWHRYRLNLGPFEQPPFLMEPYNPAYYPQMWESAGFRVVESYFSKSLADVRPVLSTFLPVLDRVRRRGYFIRPLDRQRFREELEVLYRLSTAIFAENYLYDEISLADFIALYDPVESLVDPELVRFAQTATGEYAGFLFAIPDYHDAVVAMRGRRGPLAKVRFLLRRGAARAVNLKSLGVLPEHREIGLARALVCSAYQAMLAKGFTRANLCLIRQGNPSGRVDADQGTVFRRYAMYRYLDDRLMEDPSRDDRFMDAA